MSQFVTRIPGKAGPAVAVFAVLELNDVGFSLEVLEERLGNRISVVPARSDIIHRATIVVTLDLVSRGRVALDSYRLHDFVIPAVVIERISYFVLARLRRCKSLVVGKRNRNAIVSHARSHVGRSDFLAILDQFCAGYGDGTPLGGRAFVCICS